MRRNTKTLASMMVMMKPDRFRRAILRAFR